MTSYCNNKNVGKDAVFCLDGSKNGGKYNYFLKRKYGKKIQDNVIISKLGEYAL